MEDGHYPVCFAPDGTCIGGLSKLEAYLARFKPRNVGVPTALSPAEQRAILLRERKLAEEQLAQQKHAKDGSVTPEARYELEDSIHVLDMRLSVIGNQFRGMAGGDSWSSEDGFGPNEDGAGAPENSSGSSRNGASSPPLRTVDAALEGLEWAVLKGYDWVQSMVGPNQPASQIITHADLPKDEIDFEVVQTNWYWRQQRRTLRVAQNELLRVHPMTGEIRKRVPFSDISSLVISKDKSTLTVVVKGDKANADSYQSLYIAQIVAALKKRVPDIRVEEGP